MQKAGTFDQGFATTEYLAAALLDMDYQDPKIMIKVDSETFENESMKKLD